MQTGATPFFGRIPHRAFELRGQRVLKSRDVELLGLLMQYAATGNARVYARQQTLAQRLACDVKTIQRSVARLEATGFLVRQYVRDRLGRLKGLLYDVAATLGMMPPRSAPPKATKTTTGSGVGERSPALAEAPAPRVNLVPSPKRQICRSQREESFAEREDNSAPARLSAADPVVVVSQPSDSELADSELVCALVKAGVRRNMAAFLEKTYGDPRCREALAALALRAKVRCPAGWLVDCLRQGWTLAPVEPPSRPRSQHPFRPPTAPASATAGTDDPLDRLAPDQFAALEAQARAVLIAESVGPPRALLLQGREKRLVRLRMRALLAGGHA